MLFPLTFLIALIATATDSALGFTGLLPDDMRLPAAALSFIIGAALWLWTYEQLVTHGKGSPSPVAGRTLQLVTSGIYAYSRNPSVFGKLLGVLAVGFALNSVAFCCILVPALLAGSRLKISTTPCARCARTIMLCASRMRFTRPSACRPSTSPGRQGLVQSAVL